MYSLKLLQSKGCDSALMVMVNDLHTSVKIKLFDCSAPGVSVLGMNIGEAASRRCIENYK